LENDKGLDDVHLDEGPGRDKNWRDCFDWVLDRLSGRVQDLVQELSRYDVVGFTTSFGQVLSSLVVARALKNIAPQTRVILGGASVVARLGPAFIREYGFLDYIVQGEGESPLVAILDHCEDPRRLAGLPGILCKDNVDQHENGTTMWQVCDLDTLPIPEFDDYAELTDQMGIGWALPIEGSRGCWWDRTSKTGDPKSICYFCNVSNKWSGYREKSNSRVVDELLALSNRYQQLRISFVDNVMRHTGVVELAEAISAQHRDFIFYKELRASIKPYELLTLWEAGLRDTQFGIEGLATSYLRRLGKGTTAIANLQSMRTCCELGISDSSLLITDFPGSTVEDVEETRRNILDYACGFIPLRSVPFRLDVGSTVDKLCKDFGLKDVRNADAYKAGIPEEVWNRIWFPDCSFETETPPVSWQPVIEAIKEWHAIGERHKQRTEPLISYQDGGSFLLLSDDRFGEHREGGVEGLARQVYLYCMVIRNLEEMAKRFPSASADELRAICGEFVENKLMFQEGRSYLSLAMSIRSGIAAARIRASFLEDCQYRQQSAPK
jgi:ribosomal peptide maturation radical SAM protein 1